MNFHQAKVFPAIVIAEYSVNKLHIVMKEKIPGRWYFFPYYTVFVSLHSNTYWYANQNGQKIFAIHLKTGLCVLIGTNIDIGNIPQETRNDQ